MRPEHTQPFPALQRLPDTFTILSPRLAIRVPSDDLGPAVNAAIRESWAELKAWMPWAQQVPSVEDTTENCRKSVDRFRRRVDLGLVFSDRTDGGLIGRGGLIPLDPRLPSFEIGYWCRTSQTGHGFVTEFVQALHGFAMAVLGARRVEIRCDGRNERSWRVAERAGFRREGLLHRDSLDVAGQPRDSLIYAVTDLDPLPVLPVTWTAA